MLVCSINIDQLYHLILFQVASKAQKVFSKGRDCCVILLAQVIEAMLLRPRCQRQDDRAMRVNLQTSFLNFETQFHMEVSSQ